jgi:anti-anti-sigma regulatory factor
MPDPEFKHLRLSLLDDVVLVEVMSADIQGPDRAKEFIAELDAVVEQQDATPILVDLSRTSYLSSMGYSALFKMVKHAKERRRPVKFFDMHPDVRVGAEAIGMPLVVEICDGRQSALAALKRAS